MPAWIFKKFEELTPHELYDALALRQKVFIVEQHCPYLDADGKDKQAHHLLAYEGSRLLAYARITFPGVRFREVSVGRIISDPGHRRKGLGKKVTAMGLQKIKEIYGDVPVRISAQSYLVPFYESFGFEAVGNEYDEDGIPHREMVRMADSDDELLFEPISKMP